MFLFMCCILIYMFIHIYTYICWIHTDAMITDARNDKNAGRLL